MARALAQRLFLVDLRKAAAGADGRVAQLSLDVLGSTGNLYTVHVGAACSCSCPDFMLRQNACKHMLFAMYKVLRVSQRSPLAWQMSLLPHEIEYILAHAPNALNAGVLAPEATRRAVAEATGRALVLGASAAAAAPADARKPHVATDDCAVCFDAFGPSAAALISCAACNNFLHSECWKMWQTQKQAAGQAVTCVYCRAPWRAYGAPSAAAPAAAASSAAAAAGGYVNVGGGGGGGGYGGGYGGGGYRGGGYGGGYGGGFGGGGYRGGGYGGGYGGYRGGGGGGWR
jgi:hypothetical protein